MKTITLVLALAPLAAKAGSELSYTMKGQIVGFATEKNGVCHLAIDTPDFPQYSHAYHHLENGDLCNVGRLAHQLNERVAVKANVYSYMPGNEGAITHGIEKLELNRDDKAYWPPYGQRRQR